MAEKEDKVTLQRDGENIRIHIPLKFKKRGGRKEIITPDGLPPVAPGRTPYQKSLIVALARAYRWQKLLDEGEVASISDLARTFKVDASYLSRIMRLTLLAPDIVTAIMVGQEPSKLSLEKLTKALPVNWIEQRKQLGFDHAKP